MRRSVLAWIAAVVTLVGGLVSGAGAEASAPSASIAVKLVAGQGLPGIDTGRFKADLVVTANADCRRGCDLVVGLHQWHHHVDQVVDTRTFGPGTTHRYTVRAEMALNENANVYGDVVRLVQHTSTGPRDLAGIENASLLHPDPDAGKFYDHATYGGDWRRELDFAATETMILRSRWAGSALTFRPGTVGSAPGSVGIIAETGPSAGILGVYADGTLVTRVDLRSRDVVKRKVVAILPLTDYPPELRLVNLTPVTRPGSTVSFDGLLEMYQIPAWERSGAHRMRWAPIHLRVLDQQFGTEWEKWRVRMEVSATVADCTPDCRLLWGEKVVASGSGGTQTLTATIAPYLSVDGQNPKRVTLYRGAEYLGFAWVANDDFTASPTFSHGWPVYGWPGSMRGWTSVSSTPGTGWTTRHGMDYPGAKRTVAVVSERGPRMGVMGVYADGRLLATVDLRSPTTQQRVVVASVELGTGKRLTVVNVTPPTRADRIVLFDKLIDIWG